ncbi:MAG: DUF6597 domain-containing transcriptional factor [Rectinemataceae bacterium]
MGRILSYETRLPHPALRPFIKSYYLLRYSDEGGLGYTYDCIPNGYPDIFVPRRGLFEFERGTGLAHCSDPLIVGQIERTHRVGFAGDMELFGITFNPCGLTALVTRGVAELADSIIPLAEVDGRLARALAERVHCPTSLSLASFAKSMDALFGRLAEDHRLATAWLLPMTNLMQSSSGLMPVGYYLERMDVSRRRVEEVFHVEIGCAPKTLLRMFRFTRFIEICESGKEGSLTMLAAELSMTDQAHLAHEIKRITGFKPSQYFDHISTTWGYPGRPS